MYETKAISTACNAQIFFRSKMKFCTKCMYPPTIAFITIFIIIKRGLISCEYVDVKPLRNKFTKGTYTA